MNLQESAEQSLRDGALTDALARTQEMVRLRPDDPKPRIFLFQLLCVLGQWERALHQLTVLGGLDPATLAMAQMYRDAIRAEMVRSQVFAGTTAPRLMGEPEPWLGVLIESLMLAGRGEQNASEWRRLRAFEEAPASPGVVNGRGFEWIADADSRLGPVLEAMINGRYYWIPFASLTRIGVEPPADLRDVVWMPAHLEFENGDQTAALLPARYPGSETAADSAVVLGRKTVWSAAGPDVYYGLGRRMFATDAEELSLLDVRMIAIGNADPSLDDRPTVHA